MVEISQSGSGEGSGWVTARPTLQRHFSAGPAGTQPPWDTPAAMWRVVFTPRHRWVTSDVGGRVAYRTPGIRRWRKALGAAS
jgi:hypothetical protein